MQQLRATFRSLSLRLSGIDPFRNTVNDEESAKKENPHAAMQDELVRLGVAQDYLAADIKVEEEIQRDESFKVSATDIDKIVEHHPRYLRLLEKINHAWETETEYRRIGKNLESNLSYQQFRAVLESDLQDLETVRRELRGEIREVMEKQFAWSRTDRLERMKRAYADNANRLKILNKEFKTAIGVEGIEFHQAKLEQVSKIHDEIMARILAITVAQAASSPIEPPADVSGDKMTVMTEQPKPNRWRPRILTMLILVTLVCVYFGGWEVAKWYGVFDIERQVSNRKSKGSISG